MWEKLKPYVEKGAVKTLTTDNGSEFSNLSSLEDQGQLKVYFAHAYASWEKGSSERHNGLLRGFIPKGKSLKGLKYQDLKAMTNALNQRPRKIINYYSPDLLFEQEMNKLAKTA